MTPVWVRVAAAVVGVVWAQPLGALGLALQVAPWYGAAPADTTLGLATGAVYSVGAAPATLFGVGMSPIRRGRFEFAVTWGTVFLRAPQAQSWGPADPKVFARVHLLPRAANAVHGAIEAAVRLPLAAAALFPYAFGGQDVEIQAVVELTRLGLHVGGGRIFTEPPADSALDSGDVTHATHAWAQLIGRRGTFSCLVRADALIFEIEDNARCVVTAQLVHHRQGGLAAQLTAKAETGPDRIFDYAVEIGFATALY